MSKDIFHHIILPLKDRLFRTAMSIVRDRAEAEDIVQDVLLKLWSKRSEWEYIDNLEGYCLRAVKNLALDRLSAHSFQKTESLATEHEALHVADLKTPHSLLVENEQTDRLQLHLQELPETQRLAFQLREVEGMNYKEISEALDVSEENVKISLFRARKKLKELLNKDDQLVH